MSGRLGAARKNKVFQMKNKLLTNPRCFGIGELQFDNDWSYYVGVYKIASSLFECQGYGDRECDNYESVYGNSIQEVMVKALLICRKTLVERIEGSNKS